MNMRVFLQALAVFQLISVAHGVLCWQCDSLNYQTCAVQSCPGNRCQTRTAMNGQVSHMCAVSMGADGCQTTFGERICVCSGDKCNNEGINDSGRNHGTNHKVSVNIFICGIVSMAVTVWKAWF